MDEVTKTLVNSFTTFLENELKRDKHFHSLQIKNWSLQEEYKVTVNVFLNQQMRHLYFDLREIKDNSHNFIHLIPSALAQLGEKQTS